MKRIFKLFVTMFLVFGIAFLAVGCKKNEKGLEPAEIDKALAGTYYDLQGNEAVVYSTDVSVGEDRFLFYSDGEKYVAKSGETELNIKFENNSFTLDNYGTFTKRTLAKVASEKQAVYLEETTAAQVVLREETITIGNRTFKLFENETGLYYLDGKEVYITFSTVLTLNAITLNGKTYVISNVPMPAEEGELTKLVRRILESIQSREARNYAFTVAGTAESKQTITSGAKDPSKFDLIGMILGDLEASVSGTINVRNFSLSNLTNMLAEIKGALELSVMGNEMTYALQVNVQDGKVFIKTTEGDSQPQYSVEEIPSVDAMAEEYVGTSADIEELLAKLATVEAELAQRGIKYEDIKDAISTIFNLSEKELKIDITKAKAQTAFFAVKVLILSKEDDLCQLAWDQMDEEEKTEYESYNAYKAKMDSELLEGFAVIDDYLQKMTINSCKIEINFETFATLIDVDVVVPGEDTATVEEEETVICEYNTAIKLHVEITPVESGEITKVNPEDYIVSYEDAVALLLPHLPNLELPELSENAEYEANVREYGERRYDAAEFKNVTEEEAAAIRAAVCAALGIDPDTSYIYETLIDDDYIKNVSVYTTTLYNDEGEPSGYYNVEVEISIRDNTYSILTINADQGVTYQFDYQNGTKVYCDRIATGTLEWEDNSKYAYVYCNGVILDIARYSGSYISFNMPYDYQIDIRLEDPADNLVNFSCSYSYGLSVIGPKYVEQGSEAIFKLYPSDSFEGNVDIYVDGELLVSDVNSNYQFTVATTEEDYYISIFVSDHVEE